MIAKPAMIDSTPGLPKDRDGPVFAEPWQAQAFALAVKLYEAGHFEWTEFARYLGREIAAGSTANAEAAETVYYLHWLTALEKLVADKGLSTAAELKARKSAWHDAHEATAHGQPVTLGAAQGHEHEHH